VVITSDNPRGEDPAAIIADVAAGARAPFSTEPDRARAIAGAIATARRDDIVLVAGKGHERYQDVAGGRQPFSDVAVAQACLQAWPGMATDPMQAAGS
jgi:UDP-N-acetylmuramyl tripeptide synthase